RSHAATRARPSLRVRRTHAPPARRPCSRRTRRARQASRRRVAAAAIGLSYARFATCARPPPVRRCRGRGRMIVMTVTDALARQLRDLRISVTDRCNFRCVYCMPREVFGRDYAFLERAELPTFEEIERLARIEAAPAAGLGPIKINMVVERGVNEDSVLPMARHFRGTGHIVRFIEYMDVGHSNGWRMDEVVPAADIVAMIGADMPLEPVA